jgi:hypothetical protein
MTFPRLHPSFIKSNPQNEQKLDRLTSALDEAGFRPALSDSDEDVVLRSGREGHQLMVFAMHKR